MGFYFWAHRLCPQQVTQWQISNGGERSASPPPGSQQTKQRRSPVRAHLLRTPERPGGPRCCPAPPARGLSGRLLARSAPPSASPRQPGLRGSIPPAARPLPRRPPCPGDLCHLRHRAHPEHLRSRGSPAPAPPPAPRSPACITPPPPSPLLPGADHDALLRRRPPLTSGPAARSLRLRATLTSGSRCLCAAVSGQRGTSASALAPPRPEAGHAPSAPGHTPKPGWAGPLLAGFRRRRLLGLGAGTCWGWLQPPKNNSPVEFRWV